MDDAFGATQFDWACANDWNRTFSHINAAIHRGAKVLFTSRDYIYRLARRYLKESALPVIKESHVVIHVEDLTKDEREQILYNHIRLGCQTRDFKNQLKPFLPDVATHQRFSPEIARRLGNPVFTKHLNVSKWGLDNFVANPLELLCEIINTLDDGSRSALALVFMRGGILPSPLQMTTDEEVAIARLGGSTADVLNALESLDGSLLLSTLQGGNYVWHFKHPTIRDAFATLVAENRELMDIYLTGSPLDKLFGEVSCGDVGIEGAKVIVPLDRYEAVMTRIESFDVTKWYNKSALHRFLSYRCDREFLVRFIARHPQFISSLSVGAYLYAVSDVDVIVRLHEFGLLADMDRLRAVAAIKELATDVPDSGFLRSKIKGLMAPEELADILEHVQTTLLPNLNAQIDHWRENLSGKDDPEDHFSELKSALEDYRREFEKNDGAVKQIDDALTEIERVVEELRSKLPQEPDSNDFNVRSTQESAQDSVRSIFDDVDL